MSDLSNKLPPIRRIVTGHSADNISQVLWDGTDLNTRTGPAGNSSTLIWCTDKTPTDNNVGVDVEDMGKRILGTAPPMGGTRVTVNDLPPGRVSNMHRTETVDYVFVLIGEIEMDMDDSTVTLKAGDVMVQRGTNHRWINKTDKPARVAFVLVDAEPLGIGHAITGHSVAGR